MSSITKKNHTGVTILEIVGSLEADVLMNTSLNRAVKGLVYGMSGILIPR